MKIQAAVFYRMPALWFSLLLNFLFFSLTYIFFNPGFQTNDDVGMMMVSSGTSFAAEPAEYIFFSHVLIGKLLKSLYVLSGNFPWYALYLVSVLYFSYSFIFLQLLKNNPSHRMFVFVLYSLFFFLTAKFSLLSLQFTIVAGVAALAGCSAFLFSVPHKKFASCFWGKENITPGIIFILLSSMIRLDAPVMMGILFLPAILMRLYGQKKAGLRTVVIMMLTVAAGYILYKQSQAVYSTQNNYVEFNAMRGRFADYDIFKKNSKEAQLQALKNAGWSVNDLEMLRAWFFMDEKVYNVTKFKQALSGLNSVSEDASLKDVFLNLIKVYDQQAVYFKNGCFLLFTFLLFLLLDYKRFNLVFFTLTCSFVLISFIHFYYKPPPIRILYTLLTGLCVFFALQIDPAVLRSFFQINKRKRVLLLVIFAAFYSILLFLTLRADNSMSKQMAVKNAEIKKTVAALNTDEKTLYVVWANSFYFESISPFDNLGYLKNFHVFSLGAMQRMPFSLDILKKNTIHDLYPAMIGNPNVKLILGNYQYDLNYMDKLAIYMKEHYGTSITHRKEKSFDNFGVYSLVHADSANILP